MNSGLLQLDGGDSILRFLAKGTAEQWSRRRRLLRKLSGEVKLSVARFSSFSAGKGGLWDWTKGGDCVDPRGNLRYLYDH